jgi:acyl carrier protein
MADRRKDVIERSAVVDIIHTAVKEVMDQAGLPPPAALGDETVIVGPGAVLDSLGVVSLIVEVEQALEQKHDVTVTLASDKAMSAKNSPFRSVGVLADHVLETIKEGAHA